MLLCVYYDGSTDSQRKVITLCGVAATQSIWNEFEMKWKAVLAQHRIRELHMTDLMALRKEFAKDRGWDDNKRIELLVDLWNVFAAFRLRHLLAYSCSVIMEDWNRAKEEISALNSPESISVNYCVGGLHLPEDCAGEARPVVLYFDRNEAFMHKVNRVWLKKRKLQGTLFRQIRDIIPADSEHVPIQAADMLAWIVNHQFNDDLRQLSGVPSLLKISSVIAIEHFCTTYNYEKILEDYPTGRLRAGAKA